MNAGGWTRSLIEEVIGCLWLISAVLAFGFGFDTLGWLLAIKAAIDHGVSIWFAVRGRRQTKMKTPQTKERI